MDIRNVIVSLSPLGMIEVSSVDAPKFLQGQITCDVRDITEHQSRMGAHCDPKGRVQFIFRLCKSKDNYYLILQRDLIPHALNLLQKYLIFSKTKLADVSDQWESFGLSGDAVQQAIVLGNNLIATTNEVKFNNEVMVLGVPGMPLRTLVFGQRQVINELKTKAIQYFTSSPYDVWQMLEIKAAIPSITLDTVGVFTPHELNLPNLQAVSFNKGCYTGQEIVARMHYLGKPKQNLYRVEIHSEKTPYAGQKLFLTIPEKKEVGVLVNVAPKTEKNFLALAVIQDSAVHKVLHLDQYDSELSIQVNP